MWHIRYTIIKKKERYNEVIKIAMISGERWRRTASEDLLGSGKYN